MVEACSPVKATGDRVTRIRRLLRRLKKATMSAGADRVHATLPARHVRGVSGGVTMKGTGDDVASRLQASSAVESFFDAVDARRSMSRGWDFATGSTGAAFWGQAEAYGPGDAENLFDSAEENLAAADELFGSLDWTPDLTS